MGRERCTASGKASNFQTWIRCGLCRATSDKPRNLSISAFLICKTDSKAALPRHSGAEAHVAPWL